MPTITIESLDASIPLGDSFPIVVNLKDGIPNQQVEFELVSGDIVPSTSKVTASTDGRGEATIRLTGRSTRAELNALYARAYFEDGEEIVGELYVNFEPRQPTSLKSQPLSIAAQAADAVVGVPTTFDSYVETLPVATSLTDLETASAASASGVRLQGIRFPEEDGTLGEPLDALEFSSGQQLGKSMKLTKSCPVKTTSVYLKTVIDGEVSDLPEGTKVFVSGSGTTPDKTTYTQADGKISFPFGCADALYVRVQGQSDQGVEIVTGSDEGGYPTLIWSKTVKAETGKVLTAGGLSGETVQLSTPEANTAARTAQQVYVLVERARQWEMSTHNLYKSATFPVSVVYPDRNFLFGPRAHYGRMYIKSGSSEYTIYHEFGHEVYYRRMLGEKSYMREYRQAVGLNQPSMPLCAGYLNGWTRWESQERCEAMLEGFADWFQAVYFSAAVSQRTNYEYDVPINDLGDSVPGNVGAFLWDITDLGAGNKTIEDIDNDEVRVSGNAAQRYARVASHFREANTNIDFAFIWKNRIKRDSPAGQISYYCKVAKRNTITAYGCPR